MTILRQSYFNIAFYFFFLVSFVLHTFASPPVLPYCRHDQRDALLEFKHEFPTNELESRSLSSWIKSSDCCSWEGVACDDKSGEVISLDLSFIPLNNSLKPYSGLFKLHHLRNLTLRECHLYGEILSSLGNLSHLTHLDLSENKFTGNIPFSFANLTNLSHLDISHNTFTGENFPLPLDMSKFHNLEYFDVGGNSFSGTFPTSLFMIPSLRWVSLWGNQFKGPIEFRNTSSSSKLQTLYLYQNNFEGPIPKSISNFSNLERLFLSDNHFTGPIPLFLSNLVNLVSLDLSHNNFIGPIPRSNLVNLLSLDLSNNKLDGEIPGWFWRVSELRLSHNSFSSLEKSFQVSDLTQTLLLDLGSNSFRGPLPHWICNLTSIQLLDLSNNSFSGSIPQCLRNTIVGLTTLRLRNNNLSGILPPDLFANATTWLESVDVSLNQLEGKLPKSLINCTQLKLLNVGRNKIKDKFPSWLSSLPSLHFMILRSNQFYGPLYHHNVSIGFQSLKVIDISHNHFNGTLPPFYFSNWRAMTELTEEAGGYMAGFYLNSISMEMVNKGVDTKFEGIQILNDFRAIDFSRNKFCGKIPDSIGLLKELSVLNLSGNAFTSNIPQSLVDLTVLEVLDLSQNQLSGQIPRDFGNPSFLSIMNFSHNNLEGPIPRGVQFQTQPCSVFMNNPKLYGLEDVCGESHHVPNPTPQVSDGLWKPQEQVISWVAAAIVVTGNPLIVWFILFLSHFIWFNYFLIM